MKKQKKVTTAETVQPKRYGCVQINQYFINEEKKTIVCKIFCDRDKSYDFRNPEKVASLGALVYCNFYEDCGGYEFIGRSVCAGNDEFDVELGKKIAYDKAMRKLLKFKVQYCNDMIDSMHEVIDVFKKSIIKAEKEAKKNEERFQAKMKILEEREKKD